MAARRPTDEEIRRAAREAFPPSPWYPNTVERWGYLLTILGTVALLAWLRFG